MKTEYKRDLKNNYLVIETGEDLNTEDYIVHMAEQNQIPGLLPMQVRKMNGSCYLYYDITSRQPLDLVYAKKPLRYEDILHILVKLQETLESVRKYLLNPKQLLLDPRYIYGNAARSGMFFCYIPGEEETDSVPALTEFILKRLDHEDTHAVMLGYSLYQRAAEPNFSLSVTLQDILREGAASIQEKQTEVRAESMGCTVNDRVWDEVCTDEKGKEYRVLHHSRESGETAGEKKNGWGLLFRTVHPVILAMTFLGIAAVGVTLYFHILGPTEAGGFAFLMLSAALLANRFWRIRRDKKQTSGINWYEDEACAEEELRELAYDMYKTEKSEERRMQTDDRSSEETQYLEPSESISGISLISEWPEQYPTIPVREQITIIGKMRGQADILLDTPAISRIHARVECRNGKYFVRDLNSKNGTYVDGRRLKPQEETEIWEGNRVAFANISYRVCNQRAPVLR